MTIARTAKSSLLKRLAVHRALCSGTLIERWREGKDAVEKKCTSNRNNYNRERIVKTKHTQKFWGDSQRVDCSWRCFKNDHTDVCKTWVSAVAFLVSSHSWTWNGFRSISPGLDTNDFLGPRSMQPSTRTFESTSCFLLLTNFMEMQNSFSNRTWHLHTVQNLPVPGSRTTVSVWSNWAPRSQLVLYILILFMSIPFSWPTTEI